MSQSLEYAHALTGRAFAIETLPDGGGVITIPTTRTAAKVAWHYCYQVASADILTLVIGPLLFPFFWPVCMVLIKDTPRAVLRLTKETFVFTATTNHGLGRILDHREYPRDAILEIRRSRYDPGLYVRLRDRDALTLLADLPSDLIDSIAAALTDALTRIAEKDAREHGKPF
jgi:hypothetical protein